MIARILTVIYGQVVGWGRDQIYTEVELVILLTQRATEFNTYHMLSWLVVEPYPSEKYEFVSWDDYSQLNGKTKFQATSLSLF